MNTAQGRPLGWAFLGGGLLFVALGFGMSLSSLRFLFGSATAQGTIVQVKDDPYQRNGRAWYPVVEYQVDGRTYTYTGVGSESSSYSVGQKVPIVYRPEHPDSARIHSFADLWLIPVFFGACGAAFAGMGTRVLRHREPRSA